MCLDKQITGIYNVAGAGTLTLADMVRALGNFRLSLPMAVMAPLNQIAWEMAHGISEPRLEPDALSLDRFSGETGPRNRVCLPV